jgi:hypothetical protein
MQFRYLDQPSVPGALKTAFRVLSLSVQPSYIGLVHYRRRMAYAFVATPTIGPEQSFSGEKSHLRIIRYRTISTVGFGICFNPVFSKSRSYFGEAHELYRSTESITNSSTQKTAFKEILDHTIFPFTSCQWGYLVGWPGVSSLEGIVINMVDHTGFKFFNDRPHFSRCTMGLLRNSKGPAQNKRARFNSKNITDSFLGSAVSAVNT